MDTLPIWSGPADYGSLAMARRAMIVFLGRAAKAARKEAGVKVARIAVAIDVDPSTIYRFERGLWPEDADFILSAYTAELGIPALELWARALEAWREADDLTPEEEADQVIAEIEREGAPGSAAGGDRPGSKRGRSAAAARARARRGAAGRPAR